VMQQGTLTIRNTIVANGPGANCTGGVTDGGNNLQFPGTSCGATVPVVDPLLGPLQNNGGPTSTRALLQDSPALDAGNNCALVDQRGVPRPQGSACDIGAYERGATTLHVAPAGSDASDCLTVATACQTIDAAILKASVGDTISIAAGNYRENLSINKDLSLIGAGAAQPTCTCTWIAGTPE
jgi:pectin methylesterase-like acyl-CoA thioesterase